MKMCPRPARFSDVVALEKLLDVSCRELLADVYTCAQIESALGPVFGVDEQMIADGTWYVIEGDDCLAACGGWSCREASYGGRTLSADPPRQLDPKTDAARLRIFFVHPLHTRRGLGTAILRVCEEALVAAGFGRAEVAATLAGELLYSRCGYTTDCYDEIILEGVAPMRIARMSKNFAR